MLEWHVFFIQALTYIFLIKNRPFSLISHEEPLDLGVGAAGGGAPRGILHTVSKIGIGGHLSEPWAWFGYA
jgi:hypothetical protein